MHLDVIFVLNPQAIDAGCRVAVVTTDEVHHDRVAVHGDAGMMADRVNQGALNLTACRILRVQDAAAAVAPLAHTMQRSVFVSLKIHPEIKKVTNPVARFVHDRSNHRFVTCSCSRCEGVLHMCLNGILRRFVEDGCNPALRPIGRRVLRPPFGEDLDRSTAFCQP